MAASPELPPSEIIPSKPHKARSVKVGLYPEFRPKTPWIRLKGLWLSNAGFLPGSHVKIEVSDGRMVITPDSRVRVIATGSGIRPE